jgi:hypothetical protein
MRGDEMENTDISFAIDTSDYFQLDDELIVFSPLKQEYFGVDGAGRLVIDALVEAAGSATQDEIDARIGATHTLTPRDKTLIREAVRSLVELGVVREQ